MSSLIDTNILVYRFDPRDPAKQARATEVIRSELQAGGAHTAHQCLVEFVAATTRPLGVNSTPPLLEPREACREAEEFLRQFKVLYPNEALLRLALRGWQSYGLSWFDAHLWSCAEFNGIDVLISEDFQHDRVYGSVRAINPFL